MEKRLLLATALSLAILLGYRYVLFSVYGPSPSSRASHISKNVITHLDKLSSVQDPDKNREALNETPLFLENSKMKLLLSSKEGAIRQIFLKEYGEISNTVGLVKVEDTPNFIGYIGFKYPKIDPIKYEIVDQNSHKVIFQGISKNGFVSRKEMELGDSGYTLKLTLTFLNQTKQTLPLYYELTAASSFYGREERFFEAVAFGNGKRSIFHLNKIAKGAVSIESKTAWVALKEKYFSLILKPEGDLSGFVVEPIDDKKNLALKVWAMPQDIPPDGEWTEHYLLYFGPNQPRELKKLGPWAEGTLHYGMFSGITKFLLWALTYIDLVVKNYGLSVIILTIFVSIILLPLTGISYKSMKNMKLLQPEVDKLREMYKDKPQKLNKELMGLYKRNKVNPLGGCLPMLIQMPIFIAFYNALVHSIELKGASFLFIKDLSSPDRAIPLPFQFGPLGSAINILPILMVIAMSIQQRLNAPLAGSGPDAEAQRTMTMVMPFVFGFIFYGLPSGLVLYWLTNNIVMIFTQKLLFSK